MKAFENTFLKPFDADDLQDSVCSSFGELKDVKSFANCYSSLPDLWPGVGIRELGGGRSAAVWPGQR